jgi:ribosomal protein L7/L12
MIDIFIDDDNKVTIKTTNGLAETEVATAVVLEAMRNLKKPEEAIPKVHVLYLQNCGDAKLQCVKAVKENLLLGLKEAKDLCDAASGNTKPEITRSLDINYLNRLKCRIEESGASCFIDKL